MTNGVRLEGHVMVPNLGYKKDAFLEPSLISNFLFDITLPIPPLLCLPLVVPTSKLVINPTWVLPCRRRPMVQPLGQIASFGKELNSCKSTKLLEWVDRQPRHILDWLSDQLVCLDCWVLVQLVVL